MTILKKHKRWIAFALLLVFLVGCAKVDPNTIKDNPDKILKLSTPFSQVWKDGWFDALLTYPVSLSINFLGQYVHGISALIFTVIIINIIIMPITIKSQVSQQKMQYITPEVSKINEKYAKYPKDDRQAQMRKMQEIQALYAKHGVSMTGGIGGLFIQLPIFIAMYQATIRSEVLINSKFFDLPFTNSMSSSIKSLNIIAIILFIVLILSQIASIKLPTYLAKKRKKENGYREKSYVKTVNPQEKSQKTMIIITTVMMGGFAFFLPIGMSIYWIISSVIRMVQALYIHKVHLVEKGA